MITRQDLYNDLFKLKKSGEDVSEMFKIMESHKGIPKEVVEFIKNKSPQFQFYENIHKNLRTLFKNILNYESLSTSSKIKVCSSLITRAVIAVEHDNLNESLLPDLKIEKAARAIEYAVSGKSKSLLDEVLSEHKNAILVYCKSKGVSIE